jgi:hypothetical protein
MGQFWSERGGLTGNSSAQFGNMTSNLTAGSSFQRGGIFVAGTGAQGTLTTGQAAIASSQPGQATGDFTFAGLIGAGFQRIQQGNLPVAMTQSFSPIAQNNVMPGTAQASAGVSGSATGVAALPGGPGIGVQPGMDMPFAMGSISLQAVPFGAGQPTAANGSPAGGPTLSAQAPQGIPSAPNVMWVQGGASSSGVALDPRGGSPMGLPSLPGRPMGIVMSMPPGGLMTMGGPGVATSTATSTTSGAETPGGTSGQAPSTPTSSSQAQADLQALRKDVQTFQSEITSDVRSQLRDEQAAITKDLSALTVAQYQTLFPGAPDSSTSGSSSSSSPSTSTSSSTTDPTTWLTDRLESANVPDSQINQIVADVQAYTKTLQSVDSTLYAQIETDRQTLASDLPALAPAPPSGGVNSPLGPML